MEKRKACTVAKGFTQVIGEDHEKIYASVIQLKSVHLVYAGTAIWNLCLWQIDFVSVFLNSKSTFDIYIEQLREFEERGEEFVWKLNKTLYGTMQGAHNWAENLDRTFEGVINFIQTITLEILDWFWQSKWPPKALKKTFQMVPKISQSNQYSLSYQQISQWSPSYQTLNC